MEERVLLQSNCSLYRVTTKNELDSFCCGDEDLMISFIKRLVSMMDNYWGKHILVFIARQQDWLPFHSC